MSLGTHTRHFGTRVVQTNNVHLAPRILEVETNKQTALQWYHMQRALRENSPHLSYADVVKKQSTSLGKQLSKTLPQKTSINNVKASRDQFQKEVHNYAPVNTQFDGNKRLAFLRNIKNFGKVERDAHSHIPTSNRFQILQNLNKDSDTARDSVYTDSIGQSACNFNSQRKRDNITDRAQKVRSPNSLQTNPPIEQSQVVHHLTTASMPILGSKNKTGLTPEGMDVILVRRDNPFPAQDDLPSQVNNGIAKQTNVNSCYATHDPNSLDISTQRIPDHVFANRHKCMEYNNCVQQNGEDFGFIPLTPLKVYHGDPIDYDRPPDIITAHKIVRQTGIPNFLGARIPIASQLKPQRWRYHLNRFWDKQLPDLIEYGFPLDFCRDGILHPSDTNHMLALQNTSHVEQYILEELSYGAIHGPYHEKPFPMHVSPLMVRDKPNSNKKRTIMDLSWPKGFSVNHGVSKNSYLDTYFTLHYPSIDHIVQAIRDLGPDALLYKIDISRAFRHIRIDPGDLDLLGFHHNDYYFDGSLAFGYRHGSVFFQRCSDAIRYIMKNYGFHTIFNYIDDLIYVGLPHEIHQSFTFLQHLLQDLGLEVSPSKLIAPATQVVCLGILVDTVTQTISIPKDKLQQIKDICFSWSSKTYCSKRDLQSLLGSLLYITKCIKPARYFLNRMLALLRQNVNHRKILLHQQFFADLNWFLTFLDTYNGITYYKITEQDAQVYLDASLTGLGGVYGSFVYALPIPKGFRDYSIVHLEILNILVACKIWASQWENKKIQIFCDNLAVVEVLTSGRTRDETLAICARNIWLLSALYNIHFTFSHIAGVQNTIADLLSRWGNSHHDWSKLQSLCPDHVWVDSHIDLTLLNYTI